MHSGRKRLREWIYLLHSVMTARNSVSARRLSKELSVQYRSAWYMMHRIREACGREDFRLANTVEVDETYVDGKERNKHAAERLNAGRVTVGKTAVVVRERGGKIKAAPVERINGNALLGFVEDSLEPGSQYYTDITDIATTYPAPNAQCKQEAVAHSASEYVRGLVHTNGIENAWRLMMRAIIGTWHHDSPKHLGRCESQVAIRLSEGNLERDIPGRKASLMQQIGGMRISYEALVAGNWLSSEVRSV
ncbi:MAG: IS1595 family transposase [Gammaproteobacteria bacterium]|nr:IS1595 family transposase [Gammaproteobacteria bacterium]